MSTQPANPLHPPLLQIHSPLLYIALLTPPTPLSTPHPHWSFLIGPSAETSSSTGILYTHTTHTTQTAGLHPKFQKPSSSDPYPLRAAHDGKIGMIARLVIAEITSLDALSRFMDECSDKNDITISGSSSGDNSDKSVEWIKSVLAEIDGDDDKQGARGGKDDDESCRGKGLGRRMECFESLEAEGREMWGRYVGVAREEGQEVPTRVLFDRRVPAAAAVAAVTGAGGESGGGSVERGKGWEKGDGTGDGDGDGEGETQR